MLPSPSPSPAAPRLSALTQLSPSVYLIEPPEDAAVSPAISRYEKARCSGREEQAASDFCTPPSPFPPPKLIILFTWMSAHPTHISKYLLAYRTHYPTSRILVIRTSPLDLFYRPTSTQHRRVAPAISAVLSSCPFTFPDPEVILHVFSNGGSHQVCNFLSAYRKATPCPFPNHITIFDSCPGRATFKRSVLALSSALPSFAPARLLLLVLIYSLISIYWVVFIPLGIPDPIERLRKTLNTRTVMQGETKRCYIYSDTDPMVGWHDVEAHAHAAADKGFLVQSEKFEGSGHCAHIRIEEGTRYWAIVNALWRARGR